MFNPIHESHRERLAALAIAVSRVIPGGGLLLLLLHADIPTRVKLGRDVRFPHAAHGVVIHPLTTIGDRCVIYHGVTLGADPQTGTRAPTIEDDVLIGAGAVVLGGVTLGRGCRVGANAVVVDDVPAGATAVGIPARIRSSETAHGFRATV